MKAPSKDLTVAIAFIWLLMTPFTVPYTKGILDNTYLLVIALANVVLFGGAALILEHKALTLNQHRWYYFLLVFSGAGCVHAMYLLS